MRRHISVTMLVLVGLALGWPLHVAAAPDDRVRFGFRMDLQTFLDLRTLAPELPQACFPSLTPEGQRAWETGLVTTVYNTGSYLEGDFNADSHADAALLLDEPVPNGPVRRHVLLATRPLADGPWRRVALVRVAEEIADLTVDQVLEHFAATPGSELAVFLSAMRPPADGDGKDGLAFSPDMAVEPRRSIDSWIARLDDPDPHARLEAAEALGEAGSAAKPATDALVQRFYDPEEVVRDAAAQSLRQIGPDVVTALRTLVEREGATWGRHDPGGRAQRLAVNLLG
ncbi:MAG: HEAT repeat domain-containing protein, partial [Candidatus Omnitrophica bacterium]|nr:HEAT repeat domain-containing protein [Candidatus Omnitrophota bacterium]